MKKFNFDVTVASNALNCPNPSEWYDKAYLGGNVLGNFRLVPGVKESTKISSNTFSSVLQDESCTFAATASQLSAVTVSVCSVKANTSICAADLESSFVAQEMAKGSQNYTPEAFMSHYWDSLNMKIQEEIEGIRWKGSTTNTGYTGTSAYLSLCDGYEKLLLADANVVDVTLTAVTVANVISVLSAVVAAAPAAIKGFRKTDLRIYVASNVFLAYQIATSNLYLTTPSVDATFAGIKIVEQAGMSDNKIVFSRYDNLAYAFDGESDGELVAVDRLKAGHGVRGLYVTAFLKLGFQILNPSEIVYFN